MTALPLRALTIRQPWASAVAAGAKDVENRVRPWPWTGAVGQRLAVHAGLAWDPAALSWPPMGAALAAGTVPGRDRCPRGALLGTVLLAGVHRCDGGCSPWAVPGLWHLELAAARPWPAPVPARGALGLWRVPDGAVAAARG